MKKVWIVLAALCLLMTAVLGVVAVSAADVLYGDANGDGSINNRDVALLQQYINKWDVTLGPDEPEDDNYFNDVELQWP